MAQREGAQAALALVVLNWNGADDTLECLASLRASTLPVRAIVVDNGSTGSDVERIRASGLADILIETGENLGYAGGNNVGLRHALELSPAVEFVGVLNNDTVADADCFGELVEQLGQSGQRSWAVSPATYYFDEPEKVWFAGGVVERGWPRHVQPQEFDLPRADLEPSEWLSGCCIVAHSEIWRRVGLFDPRYFILFEDCDWSFRARRLGVSLGVVTGSTLHHKVSRSLSSGPSSLLASYYFVRNGLRFDFAHSRRDLPRFAVDHLLRPTASDLVRLRPRPDLGFRWLGAAGFLIGRGGHPSRPVRQLAARRARR
jgi:GT2 family glycosyltransferase